MVHEPECFPSPDGGVVQQTVTIVVPCYNESEVIRSFHTALDGTLKTIHDVDFSILFVDDGSRDDTLDHLLALAKLDSRVRVASLSRNFGHQAALSAGIDLVDTDALITMDCDLQHPPSLIPEIIAHWRNGHEIVSTIREETANCGLLKRVTSHSFYWLINKLSDTRIIDGAADFGLLSRRAYTALREMPERHRFIRGMVSWLGFSRTFVRFHAPERFAGTSKYTLRKMLRLASDAVLSFSSTPLRVSSYCGFIVTIAGAAYLTYILMRQALVGDLVPGWGSLIATILFIGGVQLLCLGVASEYIARIYEQVKGRPTYVLQRSPRDARTPATAAHQPTNYGRAALTEAELREILQVEALLQEVPARHSPQAVVVSR
ncbi:MAG: glycosyltransferase family 2 protein [Planctomycetaceae bacterium]